MRALLMMAVLLTALPVCASAQTYPTTNQKGTTINGDINGDISGELGAQNRYRYKRDKQDQRGCYKDSRGNVTCQ